SCFKSGFARSPRRAVGNLGRCLASITPGIESNPGNENAGIKTPSPLLTNDWFSIGRVERSSRMRGKFDPEHFGIERNVVAHTSVPALRELDRLRRRWRARQAGRLPPRRPPSLSYRPSALQRGWAIATGVFQIIGAIQLRKEIDNEWLLILGGIISVLFGIGVMLAPGAGALALVWVIGAYALIIGVLLVALSFRLKKHAHS